VWLLDLGADQVESLGDLLCVLNFVLAPLGSTPVEGLALVNDVVEGSDNLLHGDSSVWSMGKDNVDVVESQVLERDVETLNDVLSRQTSGILGLASLSTEEDLGGNDNVSSVPAKLLDHSTHLSLGFTGRVGLGVVEHVDTVVETGLHEVFDNVTFLGITDGQPSTVTEDGDSKTGVAHVSVKHLWVWLESRGGLCGRHSGSDDLLDLGCEVFRFETCFVEQ